MTGNLEWIVFHEKESKLYDINNKTNLGKQLKFNWFQCSATNIQFTGANNPRKQGKKLFTT